jgi:drug/metabolite transporter (DMT)-like permease
MSPPRTPAPAAAAAAGMICVGLSVAAASRLVAYPFLTGQALRYGAAALVLLALARLVERRLPLPSPGDALRLLLLAATGMVAFNLCLLGAAAAGDPTIAGLVLGATPVALALAAPLLRGVAPAPRLLAAALVASLGAALVQGLSPHRSPLPLVLALGALVGELAFSLLAVPLLTRLRPVTLSAYLASAATALLVPLAAAVDRRLVAPAPDQALALAYMALVVTVGCFVAWYWALSRLGPERAGVFASLMPVAAVLGTAAVGTARLTPVTVGGALLVAAGLLAGLSGR